MSPEIVDIAMVDIDVNDIIAVVDVLVVDNTVFVISFIDMTAFDRKWLLSMWLTLQ